MRSVLLFIFLICCLLEGSEIRVNDLYTEETKGIITDLGSMPSSIVGGCVNVISGNFVDHETDLLMPGPESFNFSRSYCSNDTSDSTFIRHWQINHQGCMAINGLYGDDKGTELLAVVAGSFGSRSQYYSAEFNKAREFVTPPHSSMYKSGLTNISQGMISGQNNLKNSRCHFKCSNTAICLITDGAGEVQEYEAFEPAKSSDFKF